MARLKKGPLTMMVSLMLLLSILAGCGSTGASSAKKVELKAGEKVKVVWWHAMGGKLGEVTAALVEEFNKSQDKVQVEAIYQGTYDESLQKFKAAGPDGPTMIQVYEIGSRFMIDSGMITPVQNFINADQFDAKNLEPNIASYYTFDGKLHSVPFNTSTPIVYYNKDAFKAAGLDPNKPPKTFAEFHEYAKKLTKKSGNETTQYGASIALYGWFFEQLLAVQNAHFVDNENGRKAKATKAVIESKEGQEILTWIKAMVDDGSAVNLGRKTSETQAAFAAGKVAMTMDSTAALSGILGKVGTKFEVGTAFMPRPNNNAGVIIGGASNWITNLKSEKEQWAAWEFIKWLSSPEVQAKWHIATGYFPVVKNAYDLQSVKEHQAKYPQFKTAIDQLRASKTVPATQGAVIGVFPQARQVVEGAMENVVLGKAGAADALKSAAAEITRGIENYNKTTK